MDSLRRRGGQETRRLEYRVNRSQKGEWTCPTATCKKKERGPEKGNEVDPLLKTKSFTLRTSVLFFYSLIQYPSSRVSS